VEIEVVKRVGPPALLFSVLAVITFGGLYFRRRRNA
jgi:LPXTG-motif cell wall-anchored protein